MLITNIDVVLNFDGYIIECVRKYFLKMNKNQIILSLFHKTKSISN